MGREKSTQPALLVSLHLPKTAGTSFLTILEQQYGGRLYRDYGDRPLNQPMRRRCSRALRASLKNGLRASRFEAVDCIHGHFLPLKYRLLARRRPVRFVTWLRDPVERLASHYHYWVRTYNPIDSGRLHRRVVEERWDLERFCLSPELQNTYHRFLWGFPLQRFDFLGITEHFDADIQRLAERYLPGPLIAAPRKNVNVESPEGGEQPHRRYVTDATFRQTVADFHAEDMALYEAVLTQRGREPALPGVAKAGE